MIYRKNIFITLFIVLFIVLLLEFIRFDFVFRLSKNVNAYGEEKDDIKQSAISNESLETIKKERYMVVYDSKNEDSIKVKNNTDKILDYMKKETLSIDVSELSGIDSGYNMIILTFSELSKLSCLDKLIDYVNNGGHVLFAKRPENDNYFYRIYRKLGIYEAYELKDTSGIKLLSNVLLNAKGFNVNEKFIDNSSILVGLTKDCRLHAVSTDNVPLLWDITYGRGKFMVFNGTMLNEKSSRGILAGAISMLQPDFIYPVMNMKLMFIDDFPSPIEQGYNKEIYKEYVRSIPDFYKEIWWPDIRKSSYDYDLKFSTMLIETYNDWVKTPFKLQNVPCRDELIIFGREIVKNNGELGIHGYNHQSLAEAEFIKQNLGYNPWKSGNDMVASLNEINTFAKSIFPDYLFVSYVPPSNILSPLGREYLLKGMPQLKTISSVYLDDITENSYVQEFEMSKDGIAELPRISSGYFNTTENSWNIYNGITTLGVFSHFIHPDDVLDTARNPGKSWSEMYKDYKSFLGTVNNKYPWLKSMTVSQGSKKLKGFTGLKAYVERKDSSINVYCNDFYKEIDFILRTEKSIVSYNDCTGKKIDDGVYLIHSEKPLFAIVLGR